MHRGDRARRHPIRLERISREQGLSHNGVYAILQNSRGFIWFGTQDVSIDTTATRSSATSTGDAIDVRLRGTGCLLNCHEVPRAPLAGRYTRAGTPSFSCGPIDSLGWIEQNICLDAELAALDRRLADAYAAARRRATGGAVAALTAAQRAWADERNQCDASSRYSCLKQKYETRIQELSRR